MIKSIRLKNIQSHEDTEVRFDEGVNSIVGSSCAGKTAVLRAFYWVVENRPTGTSVLCSSWNRDRKGNPIDEMSATVVTEKGWVKRYRNRESNGYVVRYADGTENILEAVRTDVPEEVTKFLNICDINVQKQMDSPFLLSESAPESARYLNGIVHLDLIDSMLSKAEKNRRDVNANIKFVQDELDSANGEIGKYEGLDDALSLCERVEKFSRQCESLGDEIENLTDDISKFSNVRDYSEELSLVSEIENETDSIGDDGDEIERLKSDISKFSNVRDYSEELSLVSEIEGIDVPDISELEDEIEDYEEFMSVIHECEENDSVLRSKLPKTCPTCGKPLNECED